MHIISRIGRFVQHVDKESVLHNVVRPGTIRMVLTRDAGEEAGMRIASMRLWLGDREYAEWMTLCPGRDDARISEMIAIAESRITEMYLRQEQDAREARILDGIRV